MDYRVLGRTGFSVSAISFGAWAIGGSWGSVDDEESMRTLHAAIDSGVNFIDTADVYGDGRSERLVARLRRERPGDAIYVATKAGRRLPAQTVEGYSRANLMDWVDRSLTNLQMDAIDLLQLHCPPSPVFDSPAVYGILDDLVTAGKIRHYGVSVERVDEALAAIRHPGVKTVQIIFNMFRLKPADQFFPEAVKRQVGVLARVPLASGLLTGKLTAASTVRRRRPPQVQSRRRGVRQGRDVLRRAVCRGPCRRRGTAPPRACSEREREEDSRPAGAPLDADVRRGHLRDPRRANARPGARQRRRR